MPGAMPGISTTPMDEQLKNIKAAIELRIAQLKEADANFCRDRWDMSKPEHLRIVCRDASNKVTFARQELQDLLKLFN